MDSWVLDDLRKKCGELIVVIEKATSSWAASSCVRSVIDNQYASLIHEQVGYFDLRLMCNKGSDGHE